MAIKKTVALVFGAILLTGSLAHAEASYTVNGWPQGLATVPCDAFVHNGDTWSQVAEIIVEPGEIHMHGNEFHGASNETRIIESHCK